jgi:hypothetical protein
LFFSFSKYMMGVLVFLVFALGIPTITDNIIADNYDDWDAESSNVLVRMSVGNHGSPHNEDDAFPLWQSVLNICVMIVIYITYYCLRSQQAKDVQAIDDSVMTPGDYTILVKGLPVHFSKAEVAEFFTSHGRKDGTPVLVEKVNIPYKINDFVKQSLRHEKLKNLIFDKTEYEKANPGHTFYERTFLCFKQPSRPEAEIRQEAEAIKSQLLAFIDRAEKGDHSLLVGQAFVTFRRQESTDAVVAYWGSSGVGRFCTKLFGICRRKVVLADGGKINPSSLEVDYAPEPNDNVWENIGTSTWEKLTSRIRTYSFCTIALLVSFAMIYFASVYQTSIQDDYDNTPESDRSKSDLAKVRFLSILPSIGVVIINLALERIIRGLTFFEKHETLTAYNSSVALKLTVAQVINTALIAFVVNLDSRKDWFTPGGLVEDMSWILISNALVQPVCKVFSVQHVVKYIRRRRAVTNILVNQEEANDIYEDPPIDMAKYYASLMKTFVVTLVYAPILPFGVIVSAVGLFIGYWTDKFMLLRKHSRPTRMSSELSELMTKLIPLAIFLYSLTNFYFILVLNEDQSLPAFVWMLICAGMVILPVESMFLCLRGKHVYTDSPASLATKDYEDEAGYFMDDYDRQNPVTLDEGWDWYNDLVIRKDIDKPDEIAELHDSVLPKGMKSNLNQYVAQQEQQADAHLVDADNRGVLEFAGLGGEVDAAKKRKAKTTIKQLGGYGMPQQKGATDKMKRMKMKRRVNAEPSKA